MQIILVLYPEFIPLGVSPAIKPTHQIGHKKRTVYVPLYTDPFKKL